MEIEELYTEYRPLLLSISYRMLGSFSDAEDIVQGLFTDIGSLDITGIDNIKAYLCKMATNRSIDLLKSAQKKREVYTGPWLPEPLVLENQDDPLQVILQQDSITYALLTLMEQLNPVERAIFVLREAFDFSYSDIASLIEKEESNCRKIFSRAKKKLKINEKSFENKKQENDRLIMQFVHAASTGNMDQMLRFLSQEAVLYSDGGGNVTAAIRPIVSSGRVIGFILGLLKKYSSDHSLRIQPRNINGQTGLVIESDQEPTSVILFDIEVEKIKQIFIVRNPEKLIHI